MTTATPTWGDAQEILASFGVTEDPAYYRGYSEPDEKAVLTIAMSIQEAWIRNDAELFAENGSLLMQDR